MKYDTYTRNMTIIDCASRVNEMSKKYSGKPAKERPFDILNKVWEMLHEFHREELKKQNGK